MIALCFLLVAHAQNFTGDSTRRLIQDGSSVGLGAAPYQVSLRIKSKHNCGGTILSELIVVTAAHCLHNQKLADVTLVAGIVRLDQHGKGQKRRVAKVFRDPNRPFTNDAMELFQYDIVLIQVDTPFVFSSTVSAAKLPTEEARISAAKYGKFQVSGWGATNPSGAFPNQLKKTKVIYGRTFCQAAKDQFCAGPHGVCDGDSGGPIVVERGGNKKAILLGVASWVHQADGTAKVSCADKSGSRFTSVYVWKSFIKKVLKKTAGIVVVNNGPEIDVPETITFTEAPVDPEEEVVVSLIIWVSMALVLILILGLCAFVLPSVFNYFQKPTRGYHIGDRNMKYNRDSRYSSEQFQPRRNRRINERYESDKMEHRAHRRL